MDEDTLCPICGMEFDDGGDLDVHLPDCEAEAMDRLDEGDG